MKNQTEAPVNPAPTTSAVTPEQKLPAAPTSPPREGTHENSPAVTPPPGVQQVAVTIPGELDWKTGDVFTFENGPGEPPDTVQYTFPPPCDIAELTLALVHSAYRARTPANSSHTPFEDRLAAIKMAGFRIPHSEITAIFGITSTEIDALKKDYLEEKLGSSDGPLFALFHAFFPQPTDELHTAAVILIYWLWHSLYCPFVNEMKKEDAIGSILKLHDAINVWTAERRPRSRKVPKRKKNR